MAKVNIFCMAGGHGGPEAGRSLTDKMVPPIHWREVRVSKKEGRWTVDPEGPVVAYACPFHRFEGERYD